MSQRLRVCLYAVTGAAWLVLVLAALPLPITIDPDQTRLACAVALIGSFVGVKLRLNRSADELFAAGKLVGRAQCRAENCAIGDERVVALEARRMLRAVNGGVDQP